MDVITDDELRERLSKYMSDVPPVTGKSILSMIFEGTTRKLLLTRLEKFESANDGQESHHFEDAPEPVVNLSHGYSPVNGTGPPTDVSISPKTVDMESPKKPELCNGVDFHEKSSGQNGVNGTPISKPPINTILNASPEQIFECAARLPTYRRRSLHPNRPELSSPYTELDFGQESLMEKSPGALKSSERLPVSSIWSSNVLRSVNWLSRLLPSGKIRIIRPSRCLLVVFLAMLVFVGLLFLLLGDPFYRNPVDEFRASLNV